MNTKCIQTMGLAILLCPAALASVTVGQARFTLLADRMVRCEWSATGAFEDRPSLTFSDRDVQEPEFTWERRGDGVLIKTPRMTLEWTGGAFDATNLVVNGVRVLEEDVGNLLGTQRTLDRKTCLKDVAESMEKGIFSRRGVTVVDDTVTPLFEKTDDHWGKWVVERPDAEKGAYRDLTVFA